MGRAIRGQSTTPDDPGDSKLMSWIRDHRDYPHDYCLMWPFGRNSTGYGIIGRNGRMMYVHRYICELVHGEPTSPLHQAAHSCGRGDLGCVNPRHLSWKTPQDNQLDRHVAGRRFTGRRQKLTPQQVAEIRASHETSRVLAQRFNVTEACIRQAQAGKTYASLPAA